MISKSVLRRALAPVAILAAAASMPAAAQDEVEAKFNATCAMCHNYGAAGAPLSHDQAAWAPRLEKGMDALLASVKNGLNAMPAMGMCNDCTDAQFVELIKFVSSPK